MSLRTESPDWGGLISLKHGSGRWLAYGALAGCVVPVIAFLLDLSAKGLRPTSARFWALHLSQPSRWIFVLAPIVAGLLVALIADEKRRAREKVAAAVQSSLQGLLVGFPSGSIIEDSRGVVLSVNDRFCEVFGLQASPTNLVGESTLKILGGGTVFVDTVTFAQQTKATIEQALPVTGQEFVTTDGRVFERDYVPLEIGRHLRMHLWCYREVTERAQSYRERDRLASLFQSTEDAVVSMDGKGRIQDWNPAAERLFGYLRAEVVDKPLTMLVPPDALAEHQDMVRRVLTGENVAAIETQRLGKKGTRFDVSITLSMVKDHHGKATGISAIMRDISEHKAAEQALMQAKEDAEKASRAKSEFLANMSHEIRTPLNGVTGMADVLLQTQLTDEQRGLSRTILDSSQALLALIEDILDSARIDAGTLQLDSALFEPNAVLEQTVALFKETAQQAGVQLNVDILSPLPHLAIGDGHRLRQVLGNLLSNALKFTDRGEVRVRAENTGTRDGRTGVRFEVHDTGIGMSPQTMAHLFDPFTQRGSAATGVCGTGLGLAICKQLIEMMDGEIGVESMPGKGSMFWFTIQLGEVQDSQRPSMATPETARKRETTGHRGHVLVVEDNVINQKVALVMLKKLHYTTALAVNGEEAVEMCKEHQFDAVLMDINMPKMNGYEATEQIRTQQEEGRVPIIAMTAQALKGDRERCLQAGMDDYISKPITLDGLRGTLERWVDASQAAQNVVQLGPVAEEQLLTSLRAAMTREGDQAREDVEHFLLQTPVGLSTIRQAAEKSDARTLAVQAHALAASASHLGAQRVAERCAAVERAGRGGDFTVLEAEIDALSAEYDRFCAALKHAVGDDVEQPRA